MDFQGILKVVRIQNPKLSYKEAQKKASEMLRKFKVAQEEFGGITPRTGTIADSILLEVEKDIRIQGMNKNNVIKHGRELMPTGDLIKHGRDGVNTLVTFEDHLGNRLPVEGYFKIWI